MALRIIDLSHALSSTGMSIWPGLPSLSPHKVRTIGEQWCTNVTALVERYEGEFKEGVIVLICTWWSRYWGTNAYENHPYLVPDVARRLVSCRVMVVGVDTLGADEMKKDEAGVETVHTVILGAGGVIAENLEGVEEVIEMARPVVSLLPVKIDGCDGAPVRAVAFELA